MPGRVPPARFEHVEKAGHVGVDKGPRLLQRVPHAGLRGEVDHGLGPLAGEEVRDRGLVRDVGANVPEAVERGHPRQPSQFEGDVVVRVEVVDADHGVTPLEQADRHRRPDEPRRARDENLHATAELTTIPDASGHDRHKPGTPIPGPEGRPDAYLPSKTRDRRRYNRRHDAAGASRVRPFAAEEP